jgi:hypothetical protein
MNCMKQKQKETPSELRYGVNHDGALIVVLSVLERCREVPRGA